MREATTRREFITGGSAAAGALALTFGGGSASAHDLSINAMGPTPEQLQAFAALPDGPVVMVNLLKYKPGTESYAQYGRDVGVILEKIGARILFSGDARVCLIGNAEWDAVVLVEYPDKTALLQMAQSAEYRAISGNRESGLEGQVNYAVFQRSTF